MWDASASPRTLRKGMPAAVRCSLTRAPGGLGRSYRHSETQPCVLATVRASAELPRQCRLGRKSAAGKAVGLTAAPAFRV